MTFVKTAAYQFQQLRLKKMAEEHEAEQVSVWFDSMSFSSFQRNKFSTSFPCYPSLHIAHSKQLQVVQDIPG